MQIFLVFSLLIAAVAVIFAVQNATIITISFLVWEFQGSLALILLVALATGALINFLASLPSRIKRQLAAKSQKKRITELEAKLAKQAAVEQPTEQPGPQPTP